MSNVNNWYSEQFRAKLAEWNIIAPANYTKAELKSLYMANLSHRSSPNYCDSLNQAQQSVQENVPMFEQQTAETISQPTPPPKEPQSQTLSTTGMTVAQDSVQASMLIQMMSSMTSLMKKVLDKDEKEDKSNKTLEQFSTERSSGNDILSSMSNSSYGIHPEHLKTVDYVSESVRTKIESGKYVNLTTLLIPEFEQSEKKGDRYRDARLNRSLSIDEFIVAFTKYKRIHCSRHPWRKDKLDEYLTNIIDIARIYGGKFYEYHKIFSQKCAVALEQGKKVNWAEKDKDLLQMIIGGTPGNSCNICKEVSHVTQFCPQNINQLASRYKYQNPLVSTGADSLKTVPRKPAVCHFFNSQGCKKEKCYYLHACKSCGSVSHGLQQCTSQQITSLGKPVSRSVQSVTKRN